MQSRLMSLIEAKANIIIGLVTSYLANMLILPHVLGIAVSQGQLGIITLLFTGVSLVRSYALRRWFAKRTG
jgi:hypothetical protein